MNSKVRNQATISKKRQNNDLPSSAFCFSQLKMSFCKTVFLRCSFALKTERTAFFFVDHHLELVLEQDTSPETFAMGPQNCL